MYDTSARDKELIQALRDNASLLRENGDLRVEAERQKARIAELTRQGAAGEREGHEAALARLELENRELRARVRHLEQALAAAPPRSDTLQNDIPPAPEQP